MFSVFTARKTVQRVEERIAWTVACRPESDSVVCSSYDVVESQGSGSLLSATSSFVNYVLYESYRSVKCIWVHFSHRSQLDACILVR